MVHVDLGYDIVVWNSTDEYKHTHVGKGKRGIGNGSVSINVPCCPPRSSRIPLFTKGHF